MLNNILIAKEQIEDRISDLSLEILNKYRDDEFILLIVMNGAFRFASDLIKELNRDIQHDFKYKNTRYTLDFTKIRTYDGVNRGEMIDYNKFESNIENKNVLIIDDILDTGETLEFLIKELNMNKNPKSVSTCVLLNKNKAKIKANFIGFNIDDKFVIGYGMDLDSKYRELDNIIEYKG